MQTGLPKCRGRQCIALHSPSGFLKLCESNGNYSHVEQSSKKVSTQYSINHYIKVCTCWTFNILQIQGRLHSKISGLATRTKLFNCMAPRTKLFKITSWHQGPNYSVLATRTKFLVLATRTKSFSFGNKDQIIQFWQQGPNYSKVAAKTKLSKITKVAARTKISNGIES